MEQVKGEKPTEVEVNTLFQNAMGKTTRETQREFSEKYPEETAQMNERFNSNTKELKMTLNDESIQLLTELRNLAAHRMKDQGSWSELVSLAAKIALKQMSKERKKETAKERVRQQRPGLNAKSDELPTPVPAPKNSHNSRAIPHPLQREVWKKAKSKCTYISPITGQPCSATFGLEIEHIRPYAKGGSSKTLENLTLLCRQHNALRRVEEWIKRPPNAIHTSR